MDNEKGPKGICCCKEKKKEQSEIDEKKKKGLFGSHRPHY